MLNAYRIGDVERLNRQHHMNEGIPSQQPDVNLSVGGPENRTFIFEYFCRGGSL